MSGSKHRDTLRYAIRVLSVIKRGIVNGDDTWKETLGDRSIIGRSAVVQYQRLHPLLAGANSLLKQMTSSR